MEAELYFIAFFKHGAPQHLVAGPLVDWEDADTLASRNPQHVVVKTTLKFEVCE